MAEYWYSLSVLDYCLLGALGLVFVFQVYFYARYMAAPARKIRHDKKAQPQGIHRVSTGNTPRGVSVIVCARNEGYNLEAYLQALLTQDYPLYEVIVVNDGSEDNTSAVIYSYISRDARIRTTFVPREAQVGSSKKLALTLGAKAAKYDYLLLTDADCRPESVHWISEMMHGFDKQGTEVVLGYGAYFKDNGEINRLVRFDTLFNGLHYLGAALCKHPYMGVGRNLAYKKSLFFESGGFSHLMRERAGDDDLFINRVATGKNTAVVVSKDSLTWSVSKHTLREWLLQKRRHLSVSPKYRSATKFRLGVEPMTRGLFYALLIAIGVCGSPVTWIAGATLFAARLLMQILIIDISAWRMGLSMFGLSIVWYDICLPLVTLYMLITQPFRPKQRW